LDSDWSRGEALAPDKKECLMRKHVIALVAANVVLWVGIAGAGVSAQTASFVEGTWTLASATVTHDGKTRDIFGAHPNGTMIFDPHGRFSQVIIASDLPKFASKSRESGTAEENKAVVQGSIAYFGTYKVSSGGVVDLHIESSTFPNMSGSDQTRSIKITGDELIWGNPTPAVGAGVAEQLWKRAK
jgi:hypothetical protein